MDPAEALNLVSAGLRTAASVGKFMEARNHRKAAEARRAGARPVAGTRPAARPVATTPTSVASQSATVTYVAAPTPAIPILTPEELDERADSTRRDIFIVLGILGEKLLALGVVNDPWLPFAREEVLKAFRMKGPLLATMFETEMEEVMQYAVTAALFLCAGCWPMHIYRGFGACVLNDWLWGYPHPQYAGRPEEGECGVVDACLALLKTATQGHEVLKGYPVGLNRVAPNYAKLSSEDERWYHDAKNGQMKKRGMPVAMDGTFAVNEVIWPWSHYNSGFAVQNSFSYEWGKMTTPLSWQQDPGRMIYAFTIGGFLELQPGQMIEPVNEITTAILWWLYGLNGTTFKLILQGQLSVHHWKLKPKYQMKWNQELGKAVYAIRDEQRVQMRNAVRMSMPPGMAMPGGPQPGPQQTPPQAPQQLPEQIPQPSPSQTQVQTPVSPTSSIPGYPPAFTPAPGASTWQPPQTIPATGPSPSTTASSPAQYTVSPEASISQNGELLYSQPAVAQSAPAVPGQYVQTQGYPQVLQQPHPHAPVYQTAAPVHTGSWPTQPPQAQRTASVPLVSNVGGQPGMLQLAYVTPQQQPMPMQPGFLQPGQMVAVTPAPQQHYPQQHPRGYFQPQSAQQTPDLASAFSNLSIAPQTQQPPPQSAPPATHFPPPAHAPTPAPPTSSTSPPPIAAPQPVAPVAPSITWEADASAWTGPLQSPGLEVAPPPAYSLGKVEVQYDFVGRMQGEMSVKKGDVLEVIRDATGDGWVVVRKADEEGRVPEAYVRNF